MMLHLNEDLIEVQAPDVVMTEPEEITDKEIEPRGPSSNEEFAIADLLQSMIIGEYDTIGQYNSVIATVAEFNDNNKYSDIQNVIADIIREEFTHVGELQNLLSIISPNSDKIKEGEEESANMISGENTQITAESMTEDFDVDKQEVEDSDSEDYDDEETDKPEPEFYDLFYHSKDDPDPMSGYIFSCDPEGNVDAEALTKDKKASYNFVMSNTDKFDEPQVLEISEKNEEETTDDFQV